MKTSRPKNAPELSSDRKSIRCRICRQFHPAHYQQGVSAKMLRYQCPIVKGWQSAPLVEGLPIPVVETIQSQKAHNSKRQLQLVLMK